MLTLSLLYLCSSLGSCQCLCGSLACYFIFMSIVHVCAYEQLNMIWHMIYDDHHRRQQRRNVDEERRHHRALNMTYAQTYEII